MSYKHILAVLTRLIPGRVRCALMWHLNPKFVVGVAGVVFNARGDILLVRHVFHPEHPWGLPGGWIQAEEALEAALAREIREETGLLIQVGDVLWVDNRPNPRRLDIFFEATAEVDGPIWPNGEIFEGGFYPPDAMPGPLQPSHYKVIHLAVARRKERLAGREVHRSATDLTKPSP